MKEKDIDRIEELLFDSVFGETDSFFTWEPEYCPKFNSNQAEKKMDENGVIMFHCYTCGYLIQI